MRIDPARTAEALSSLFGDAYHSVMTEHGFEPFATDTRVSRILDIVAKETRIDRGLLQPNATLDELGIESLDLTMAVFQLEETFDIEIPVVVERAGTEFHRVADLVDHVIAILDRKAAHQSEDGTGASQP